MSVKLADPSVAILNYIRLQQHATAVVWDKDSTLANTEHRHWMIPEITGENPKYTWVDYAMRCERDVPVPAARELMRMLAPNFLQIVASGAAMEAMVPIGKWIMDNNFPVDMIRLRPEGDHTENGLLKARMVNEMRNEGAEVGLFIEDNQASASVIEDLTGVPVLVLNPRWGANSIRLASQTSGSI